MQPLQSRHEDTVHRKKLIHLLLLGHCQQVEDVRVGLEVIIFLLLATSDALFHYLSKLFEHWVDVALANPVEHGSEVFFSFKNAGLRISLSQALFELGLPDRRL